MRLVFSIALFALGSSCLPAADASEPAADLGCLAASCDDPSAPPNTMPAPLQNTLNVLGEPLQPCSIDPLTGFYRDGFCRTGDNDRGVHVVCAEVNEAFLTYTAAQGNDLSTPSPRSRFPGLNPGDRWCLCASRWEQARQAGAAPPVVLESTDAAALNIVAEEHLRAHALESNEH